MNTKVRFLSLAFLASAALTFSSCGDKGDDTESLPSNYTETTDTATGRAALKVTDNGSGTGTITWKKDKVYVLDGLVFVNSGQTLTIEAGTVIKGLEGNGDDASALVVARGGKIIAEGTATEPIIFTAAKDKLNNNLTSADNGLWGGLIVLGKAKLNSSAGETSIEGISTLEARGLYGGTDDADNSGILRYVSVRHGGTDIGANNEINGITFGGVGSGTTVDYIEVFGNKDDGIELFGGKPNIKHLVVAHCGDDAIDYDEGFRGNVQFAFVYANADTDRGGEHDGGTDPEDGKPYALPKFYNVTSIGNGTSRALTFRDNAGGDYHNSVFINYGKGVDIELLKSGESSFKRFEAGELKLQNNSFFGVAGDDITKIFKVEGADIATTDLETANAKIQAYFTSAGNKVENLISTSNPVPAASTSAVSTPTDSFFTATTYRGAFEPTKTAWITNWTKTQSVVK